MSAGAGERGFGDNSPAAGHASLDLVSLNLLVVWWVSVSGRRWRPPMRTSDGRGTRR